MARLCVTAKLSGKSEHFRLQPPWEPRVISVFCAVRFISRQAAGKTWTATPKKAELFWLCLLQDSKLSFPVFPDPLSEVGLMTLYSFISFLLSTGMEHEKKLRMTVLATG